MNNENHTHKLSDYEKIEIVEKFKTGLFSFADLSREYSVSPVSIRVMLKNRGYKARCVTKKENTLLAASKGKKKDRFNGGRRK